MATINLYNADCEDILKTIPSGSVDLLLQDLPYAVTANQWDQPVDLAAMWPEWLRIAKPNAAFVFTAQQPFATDLINSNRKLFRYDLILQKSRPTGFLNANRMPLRTHEHILIFYRSLPTYNPQMNIGKVNHVKDGSKSNRRTNNNYGDFANVVEYATTEKNPISIIHFNQQDPNKTSHPTEKPVGLMRYLIRTYSNPGELVYDGYSGSGTTALAIDSEQDLQMKIMKPRKPVTATGNMRMPGWYGNYYWSGKKWSTLTRSVAGHRIAGQGKTRDEAARNFARLSKDARKNPMQSTSVSAREPLKELIIGVGSRLVNPLHEPIQANGFAPIRRVVAITNTDILLDNGQSLPVFNERGARYTYRLIESVPEKYLPPTTL